jgi:hypothetical protein
VFFARVAFLIGYVLHCVGDGIGRVGLRALGVLLYFIHSFARSSISKLVQDHLSVRGLLCECCLWDRSRVYRGVEPRIVHCTNMQKTQPCSCCLFSRMHHSRITQQGVFGDHPLEAGPSRYVPHTAGTPFQQPWLAVSLSSVCMILRSCVLSTGQASVMGIFG